MGDVSANLKLTTPSVGGYKLTAEYDTGLPNTVKTLSLVHPAAPQPARASDSLAPTCAARLRHMCRHRARGKPSSGTNVRCGGMVWEAWLPTASSVVHAAGARKWSARAASV